MKDFYQLFAFFNSIDGRALDGNSAQHAPITKVASPEHLAKLAELQKRVDEVQQQIAAEVAKVAYDDAVDVIEKEQQERADYVWIDDDIPSGAKAGSDGSPDGRWPFVTGPDHPVF